MDINLGEVKQLINQVMYARTKQDAQPYLRKLEFKVSVIKGNIDRCLAGKLSEAINYAKEASGQVLNKEHWISNSEQSWYVFENGIIQERSSKAKNNNGSET